MTDTDPLAALLDEVAALPTLDQPTGVYVDAEDVLATIRAAGVTLQSTGTAEELREALRMLADEPEAEFRATDAAGNVTFEWRGITKGQAEMILRAATQPTAAADTLDVDRLATLLAVEFGKAGFFTSAASMEFLTNQAAMMLAAIAGEYEADEAEPRERTS